VYVLSFSQILDRPQHRWDGTAAASTPIETDLRKRYSLEPLDVVDERWHAFVDVPDMESPVFPPALGKHVPIRLNRVPHRVRVKLNDDPVFWNQTQNLGVPAEVRVKDLRSHFLSVYFRVSEKSEKTGVEYHLTVAKVFGKPQQIPDGTYPNAERISTHQRPRRVF
jgi:hypothetical protein